MASVGWKRQYEVDTLCDFFEMMLILSRKNPGDTELAAFTRKAKMVAIMQLSQEGIDLKNGDPATDRINDCRVCRQHNGGRCYRDHNPDRRCIYERADIKLRVLLKHYGEEAKRWIEEAGKLAQAELEAKA